MDDEVLRRVNLIEILQEEAEDTGVILAELPADAAQVWTEQQIRDHFKSATPAASPSAALLPTEQVVQQPCAATFAEPTAEEFKKWFPGLAISKTTCPDPRWRVLCFPNAGNAEDMYTNEGTGPRRAVSPLLDWCRANRAECMAVQPPGRGLRSKEACITAPRELARQLLPVVASRLATVPYVVIAHSVGTWNAFEFLHLARAAGLPLPRHVFLSAMAAPDIPEAQRPWRQQRELSEPEFQDECRSWDVNEIVFSKALWPTYHQLMRSDFQLFDEYIFEHEGDSAFNVPISAYNGSRDSKISREMVAGWQRFTTADFLLTQIEGHHLWPLEKAAKVDWQSRIAAKLETL